MTSRTITVACSPDADDLFMMRAFLTGRLDTGELVFKVDTHDTHGLNALASGDGPDVCAISTAWYPQIAATYQMLPHGGSMGEGYGPVVIAREPMTVASLAGRRVAVPGTTTTAYQVLRRIAPIDPVIIPITPYERIFDALRAGEVDAGLVIHEGRLTYERQGFRKIVDLGEWWAQDSAGLPLPLGANAIRRDLGPALIARVSGLLAAAIRDALDDRAAAIDWLIERGSALRTPAEVDRYLQMYANERTYDYGEAGRDGVARLLHLLGHDAPVDFAP